LSFAYRLSRQWATAESRVVVVARNSRSSRRRRWRRESHAGCGSSAAHVLWGRAHAARCTSIQHQRDLLGKVFSCMVEYRTTTQGPLFIQSQKVNSRKSTSSIASVEQLQRVAMTLKRVAR